MSNSKTILLSLFLIFLSACSERTIDRDQLVERDGVFYEKFSTEPFTGSVTGRTSGRMSKGLFNGLVTTFDEEGRLSAQLMHVNGLANGEYSEFYPSGQLKSKGRYKDDVSDGNFEMFSESGTLSATYTFVAGKLEGIAYFYRENGELWFSEEYDDDIKNGEYREYYEGGSLKTHGTYRNGFKFGKWAFSTEKVVNPTLDIIVVPHSVAMVNYGELMTENGESAQFHKNGYVESAGLRKNGLKDGSWKFYDEEGGMVRTVEYEDGKELGSSE